MQDELMPTHMPVPPPMGLSKSKKIQVSDLEVVYNIDIRYGSSRAAREAVPEGYELPDERVVKLAIQKMPLEVLETGPQFLANTGWVVVSTRQHDSKAGVCLMVVRPSTERTENQKIWLQLDKYEHGYFIPLEIEQGTPIPKGTVYADEFPTWRVGNKMFTSLDEARASLLPVPPPMGLSKSKKIQVSDLEVVYNIDIRYGSSRAAREAVPKGYELVAVDVACLAFQKMPPEELQGGIEFWASNGQKVSSNGYEEAGAGACLMAVRCSTGKQKLWLHWTQYDEKSDSRIHVEVEEGVPIPKGAYPSYRVGNRIFVSLSEAREASLFP